MMTVPRYLLALYATHFLLCALAAHGQVSTWQYQYDANGNLAQTRDPLGNITVQEWDNFNRLVRTQQPAPVSGAARPVISYSYDGRGQLTSVTDPRNLSTTYTVSGLGDTTARTSPDTGTTTNSYDEAGNLKTSTDANGQSTSRFYDALNRLTRMTYSDGSVASLTYDQGGNGIGRLTTIEDGSGKTEYNYDQQGNLLLQTQTINAVRYATSYSYDAAGRLLSMTYPSGRQLIYQYDALGQLSQINTTKDGETSTVVSQITYRSFGDVASFVNGANRTVSRTRNLDGQMDSYTLGSRSYAISNNAAGQPISIAELANSANVQRYGYDNLGRLNQASSIGGAQSFSHDASGNRTGKVVGSAMTNYAIAPASNRITQASGAQNVTYSSDANGSIVGSAAGQFAYDARGRMKSTQTALGNVQYKVNALGQRVSKTVQGTTTVFHYDPEGKLIGETIESSNRWTDYVYLGDMPVALFK